MTALSAFPYSDTSPMPALGWHTYRTDASRRRPYARVDYQVRYLGGDRWARRMVRRMGSHTRIVREGPVNAFTAEALYSVARELYTKGRN